MRAQPAASRAPFGRTSPPPLPTPALPLASPPATSAAPQREHRTAAHEGTPRSPSAAVRILRRAGCPQAPMHHRSIPGGSAPHTAVEVGSCFVEFWAFSPPCFATSGSAERAPPCVGWMSFCGADAEVVRRGPALACGCADVAPAFFDALYPLRVRPVWALCPCPSSFSDQLAVPLPHALAPLILPRSCSSSSYLVAHWC
ncbi:hypothetical protein B0H13DRAFT_826877 [Mycena leptocephala]|nr:hypothetical protein B0H13DRAFT_826877 [Mycena leptocephala]